MVAPGYRFNAPIRELGRQRERKSGHVLSTRLNDDRLIARSRAMPEPYTTTHKQT